MSCNNCKKEKCNNKRASFLSVSDLSSIGYVLKALEAGFARLSWPTDQLTKIVEMITAVLEENVRLRALLGFDVPNPPQNTKKKTITSISFGPANAYTLHMPITSIEQRQKMASALFEAATELRQTTAEKIELPAQLPLPFTE